MGVLGTIFQIILFVLAGGVGFAIWKIPPGIRKGLF